MPTPEARELEARDKVTKARRDCEVLAALDSGASLVMQIRFDTAMDAYRTAVRAALVAEMQAAPPQERVSEAMVETLAKRLAAEAYVDTRHRDLLPVEPFSWDVMLTDFQREQWSGRARLHLDAALSAGRADD
jgi:hypothetical protein